MYYTYIVPLKLVWLINLVKEDCYWCYKKTTAYRLHDSLVECNRRINFNDSADNEKIGGKGSSGLGCEGGRNKKREVRRLFL